MTTRVESSAAAGRRRAPALVLAVLILLAAGGTPPAAAVIPVTDYAHIALNSYWHYFHYLQFAYQIVQQYQQLLAQARQIELQLQALQKLADPRWRDVSALLGELDGVMRQGTALGYSLADVTAQFRATFPGVQRWADPAAYPLQGQRTLDTLGAALAGASRQGRSLAEGELTLAGIRQQTAATHGTQEALEQLATLSAFSAQEQLLIRQALAAAANSGSVAAAFWINRDAQAEATREQLAAATATTAARGGSPGWTFTPGWWPPR